MRIEGSGPTILLLHGFGAAIFQARLEHAADIDAGLADIVAGFELLQTIEVGDERVAFAAADLACAQGLERHPDEGDAEEEEQAHTGGHLRVIHDWPPVS